jgi:lipopolysaccharide transport system ATP-binding protein
MSWSIKVSDLGKKYTRGEVIQLGNNFREAVVQGFKKGVSRFMNFKGNDAAPKNTAEFWALQNINIVVNPGEVLGVVGRNGAGKSTLLKILSRITVPTSGEVRFRGHMASLLEVGTGFHRELTGRENVFLNGAILGMKRYEISQKFDRIVEFANIGNFIDTPVKFYSSGMYVRLAFAVAAHLEPDILLIDEVLAVGDQSFQRKCIGKMDEVGKSGRTILFVSHSMPAMQQLCTRALLIDGGKIVEEGSPKHVAAKYLQSGLNQIGEKIWPNLAQAPGDDVVRLKAVRVLDATGRIRTEFDLEDEIIVELEFYVLKAGSRLDASFYFYNESNILILISMDNLDSQWNETARPVGLHCVRCKVPGRILNEGRISVQPGVAANPDICHAGYQNAVSFQILDDMSCRGVRGNYTREWPPTVIRPRLHWETEYQPITSFDIDAEVKSKL